MGLVDNTRLGLSRPKDLPVTKTLALPRSCFVYIVHAVILTLLGTTFLQIQVGVDEKPM